MPATALESRVLGYVGRAQELRFGLWTSHNGINFTPQHSGVRYATCVYFSKSNMINSGNPNFVAQSGQQETKSEDLGGLFPL